MIGTSVGHYRILEVLGKGGMGEVYLAQDTNLDRRVALKVLAPALSADPARRERFVREAKAVAALNHPNIVTVYSVEHDSDVYFLTMELVEGRTLSELIPTNGLPLQRLLDISIPLADAVAAAHERGITHRDLKPANVMVTPAGRVKVLDFGLAKLAATELPVADETALGPSPLTGEGRIVGTVSYMSPEQAEGKAVDHRSDIFSLGVMLYEMATGTKPFTGDTSLSVLSAIVKDTPRSVTDLNPRVPRELARVIRRCLVKDPEQRFQNAKDLRNELQELQRDLASGELDTPASTTAAAPAKKNTTRNAVIVMTAIAAIAAAVATSLLRDRSTAPAAINASFTQLTFQPGQETLPSISPDGKWVVYAASPNGNSDILLQSVGGQNVINLTKDSPDNDTQPAFSPNGDLIAFRSSRQGGGIFVMGRTGEFVRRVGDATLAFSPTWSPDGTTLAYATELAQSPYARVGVSQLWTVVVATGEKHLVWKGDAMDPSWSPNNRLIAYWGVPNAGSQRDIYAIPAAGGTPIAVTNDEPLDANPIWASDGRSIYFVSDRGGSLNLWQVPVDPDRGAPTGPPVPITIPSRSVNNLSLSADGRSLVFASSAVNSVVRRFTFDPVTGATVGDSSEIFGGSRLLVDLDVSRDGQRLAYRVGQAQEDLFIGQTDGTHEQQLTSDRARDRYPHWSPDGKRIVFYSDRSGSYELWTIAPDGSNLRKLTDSATGGNIGWPFWSPDGTRVGATDVRQFTVKIFDPDASWSAEKAETLPSPPTGRFAAWSWSPDGRKIAGSSGPLGLTVYDLTTKSYQGFDNTGVASSPVWLPDSRRLVFYSGNTVSVVDTATGAIKAVLSVGNDTIRSLTISKDGRQLFLSQGSTESDIWLARLK